MRLSKFWVPFIGLFSSILLAVFVLRCNPRNWIFRTYFIYALNLAILNLGLLGLPSLLNLGLILLPISFFQFVLSLRKNFPSRDRVVLGLAYLVGIVLFL